MSIWNKSEIFFQSLKQIYFCIFIASFWGRLLNVIQKRVSSNLHGAIFLQLAQQTHTSIVRNSSNSWYAKTNKNYIKYVLKLHTLLTLKQKSCKSFVQEIDIWTEKKRNTKEYKTTMIFNLLMYNCFTVQVLWYSSEITYTEMLNSTEAQTTFTLYNSALNLKTFRNLFYASYYQVVIFCSFIVIRFFWRIRETKNFYTELIFLWVIWIRHIEEGSNREDILAVVPKPKMREREGERKKEREEGEEYRGIEYFFHK
jgi:hypothetical protein